MSLRLPFSVFAQVIVGPPGSGKSTYCNGVQQFFSSLGRPCFCINLDPANETMGYDVAVDVRDLISLDDVMNSSEYSLGPNGGLIFCTDYIVKNMEWLRLRILAVIADAVEAQQGSSSSSRSITHEERSVEDLINIAKNWKGLPPYFLIDCPGQVELFTQHTGIRSLFQDMQMHPDWQLRLASVHLTDVHHCAAPDRFVAALLLALTTMLHLELPHVNVISKIDLLEQLGPLPLGLDFYTEVLDLDRLLMLLDEKEERFCRLNQALCELVQDFNMVSFCPLNISDKYSVDRIVKAVDRALGYKLAD